MNILGQLGLFDGVKLAEPEPNATVRLGRKTAQIPLRRKRREATKRLVEILEEMEGKDIYIGSYDAGGRHYWLNNLKLTRLQLEWHPVRLNVSSDIYRFFVESYRGIKDLLTRTAGFLEIVVRSGFIGNIWDHFYLQLGQFAVLPALLIRIDVTIEEYP
jgi:hypothetical protein